MADKKITQLNNITGADLADADEFVVVDITSDETKAITFNELKTAFDTGTGFVRVTGDTMTGALNVESTITSDGMIVDGDVTFGDNDKAIFGAGSDLQIYHDGSNSYIKDAGTGSLRLRGTDLRLESSTLAHNFITCTEGGGVYVYHNDLSKLATTATGIDVTGTVTSDGLTVTGSTGSVATVRLQAEELHADIVSVNEGVNYGGVKIQTNSNGTLKDRLKIESNGDISFYEDTGTTAKFHWDAADERLGIGTSSPSEKLHVVGTIIGQSNDNYFGNYPSGAYVDIGNLGTTEVYLDTRSSSLGSVPMNLRTKGSGHFAFINGTTEAMRIDSTGQVGIGTSSPTTVAHFTKSALSGFSARTAATLTLENSGDTELYLASGPANTGQVRFGDSGGNFRGAISYDHISDAFLHYTAGAERMRIDSSGNVGIGVVPSRKLHVVDTSGGNIALLSNGVDADLNINLTSGVTLLTPSTGTLAFGTSSTERMRIDSSGNLLVGTTSSNYGAVGSQIGTGGNNYMTRSGAQPLLLNRLSSDGDILLLMKDGTTVGSIGYNLGALTLDGGSSRSGLYFGDGAILPRYNSSLVNGVNADLGATAQRYQDLYLSGGVFLGGTGTANKLDDYEEGAGNLTITGTGGGTVTTSGSADYQYTKVGNLVSFQFEFNCSSISGVSGTMQIALPFVSQEYVSGSLRCYSSTFDGSPFLGATANTSQVYLQANKSGSPTQNILSTGYYFGQITYRTT